MISSRCEDVKISLHSHYNVSILISAIVKYDGVKITVCASPVHPHHRTESSCTLALVQKKRPT